jgi:sugar phosphate isomerase/epimerase
MKIKFLCPRWGFDKIPWDNFLADVKAEGYAGIEWFPYSKEEDYNAVLRLLHQHDLEFAIVMAVKQPHQDFNEYLSHLQNQLTSLCCLRNDTLAPLQVSAQTGREYFTEEQVERCLECCAAVSKRTGVPIYQETHRNKWSYAAHVVLPFLDRHPELMLTLDMSHWFCVSESYLDDQQLALQKAVERTRHIHARIGHTEGPQVWDPLAPEYADALQAHLHVWDKWIERRIKDGAKWCTITPEFGPPPYMVFANRKGSPQQEQWRLNKWMKNLLEKRYEHHLNKSI